LGSQGVTVSSSTPRKLTLRSTEDLADGGGLFALRQTLALDWSISQEVTGSRCESRFEGRLEIKLVEARLRRPSTGGGIRSPYENPAVIGAISDKRPLAALDLALVETKFLDAGRGCGELIASLLRLSGGITRVISKGDLLFGVSLHLLLSRRVRRSRLGSKMRASGRCQRKRSSDQRGSDSRENNSTERKLGYTRGGSRQPMGHT
jgi:hypothetical protein